MLFKLAVLPLGKGFELRPRFSERHRVVRRDARSVHDCHPLPARGPAGEAPHVHAELDAVAPLAACDPGLDRVPETRLSADETAGPEPARPPRRSLEAPGRLVSQLRDPLQLGLRLPDRNRVLSRNLAAFDHLGWPPAVGDPELAPSAHAMG